MNAPWGGASGDHGAGDAESRRRGAGNPDDAAVELAPRASTGDSSWSVLALAILVGGLAGPGLTFGVAVFIDHLVVDLALSRTAVGTAYLIGTLFGALLLPWVGSFIDRSGVRRSQIVIGLLFAVALANMAFVNGFVWLVVGFAGIRFLGQGALTLVTAVTVQVSFHERRGWALGAHTTGVSALTALAPLVLALGIGAFGWRATWMISAVVIGVVVAPAAALGLHRPVHRRRVVRSGDDLIASIVVPSLATTRGEAIRTPAFWMLAGVIGTAAMMVTALHFHQIDLLGEIGFSAEAAAALFVPQVVGSMAAGLLIGWASDRFGVRYVPAGVMAAMVATLALGAVVQPGAIVLLYTLLLGVAAGAMRSALVTIVPMWFGLDHVGSITGTLTFCQIAASAVGPVLVTSTVGIVGSYTAALLVLSLLPLTMFVVALIPLRTQRSLAH